MEKQTVVRPLWSNFEYKAHQLFGIHWMLERESAGERDGTPRGGILADEMGLGKTIQMAGLFKNGQKKAGEQILLVAPVAVLEQWRVVLRKSGMTVLNPVPGGYSWRAEEGAGAAAAAGQPRVHVIGYERLLRSRQLAQLYRWDRAVFDEAHRLPGSGVAKIIEETNIRATWLLTATPIVNAMAELRTLLSIVGVEGASATNSEATLKKYVLARTMDQLRSMIPDAPPPPRFQTIELEFATEEEADFYKGIQGVITRRWRALEADSGSGSGIERLKLFMRLRQLSVHPQVYIEGRKQALRNMYRRPDWVGSSTKFDAIQRLLAAEPGRKWIVFCQFRREIELLQAALRSMDTVVGRVQAYHGGLTQKEKEKVLAETQEPLPLEAEGESEVLLVQLQSGGTGLNLQHFDRIIFSSPWWTAALMNQAVGRAVRIGQRAEVVVYNLHLKVEAFGKGMANAVTPAVRVAAELPAGHIEIVNIDSVMQSKARMKGALCAAVLGKATNTTMLPLVA